MRNLQLLLALLLMAFNLQAKELVYQDKEGTIRWTGDNSRVALFGANYCLPSACDYRAAAYVGGDRDEMIAEDLDHFKRMNWDGLRLCFWGDWQNTDAEGNLIDNDHLRLLEKLIYEADKRDIYMLLSPIVTYNSQWPEMNDTTNTGFMKVYSKGDLILNPKAIKAEKNYITQLLNHTNRYTGRQIKDEPKILFIELINEPSQFADKSELMTAYINGMVDAIRATGCHKLTFYNVSQDFDVAPIVAASKVNGGTYAWYPQSLNNNRNIKGNPLLCVDRYEQLLDPVMARKSKIVYEFDATDRNDGFEVPAMVREFARGGCQFAAMFSYDMLRTASKNLGWHTHLINMVYTPRKAMSAIIAAEVIRRYPAGAENTFYPKNNVFGDFSVCYNDNAAVFNNGTHFYHSNSVGVVPKDPSELKHIAAVGSSPLVKYDGNGIYFIDKNNDGSWTLELFPDIITVSEPFDHPSPYKEMFVTDCCEHQFTAMLPGISQTAIVYPGIYRIDADGIIRISDHPQQDMFAAYKGWNKYPLHGVTDDVKSFDWYNDARSIYDNDVIVMDASEGTGKILYSRNYRSPECYFRLIIDENRNKAYELRVKDLTHDNTWLTGDDVTLSKYIGDLLAQRKGSVPKSVIVRAKGLDDTGSALVNFIDADGNTVGTIVPLKGEISDISMPVADFKSYKGVILPQDWPGVCSYYLREYSTDSKTFNWDKVEKIQVSLRGDLYTADSKKNKGVIVEKIALNY